VIHARERESPRVQELRNRFREQVLHLATEKLVFLDECGCSTSMTRLYGRAAPGERVEGAVPGGHWKITSILGALRSSGICAVGCLEAAVDGASFLSYIQEVLVPTLQADDVVVLDNLGSHRVSGIQEAIEAVGAKVLYLPPYSPDLNPIEKCWSKLKQRLRSAAARTQEALWTAIEQAFAAVSIEDIRNWIASCGYTVQ
jgi:transposase